MKIVILFNNMYAIELMSKCDDLSIAYNYSGQNDDGSYSIENIIRDIKNTSYFKENEIIFLPYNTNLMAELESNEITYYFIHPFYATINAFNYDYINEINEVISDKNYMISIRANGVDTIMKCIYKLADIEIHKKKNAYLMNKEVKLNTSIDINIQYDNGDRIIETVCQGDTLNLVYVENGVYNEITGVCKAIECHLNNKYNLIMDCSTSFDSKLANIRVTSIIYISKGINDVVIPTSIPPKEDNTDDENTTDITTDDESEDETETTNDESSNV